MPRILGQSGVSLADTYDVAGSVVGIDTLESRGVGLVHEMGSTIFAERLSGRIAIAATGDIAQNTVFAAIISNFPSVAIRILGVMVAVDTVARVTRAAVMVRTEIATAQELPIWIWDGVNTLTVRMVDAGTESNVAVLVPEPDMSQLPSMLVGDDQPEVINQIVVRGLTSGFGAGTVEIFLRVYVAFAGAGGITSRGVPIPGW